MFSHHLSIPFFFFRYRCRSLLGVEYRFLKEITKQWNIHLIKLTPYSWTESTQNVQNLTADVGLCSVWMLPKHYEHMDFSHYVDFQCATFLVPPPSQLPYASFVYMSMHSSTWLAFGISFIITWIALIYTNRFVGTLRWADTGRIFFNLIGLVTANAVARPPKQRTLRLILLRYDKYATAL